MNIFSVTALIFNSEGLVLAVSRKNDSNDFGLIGGKVDQGEWPEQAIIREVKEETGLNVIDMEQVYDRVDAPGGEKVCRCFLIKSFSGEISTKEAGVVKWVDYDILTKGTFGYYNINLLKDRPDLFVYRNCQEQI